MGRIPFGYILVFLLALAFLYYRFLRGTRGPKRRIHGRDLWRERMDERRGRRMEGAESWDERRHRKQMYEYRWKIADRYLKKPDQAQSPPENPETEPREGVPEGRGGEDGD
ncbi:MAG: hypothetical protein V1774_09445 [Candidatus Eisenbacteria bacterium]